MTRLKFAKDSFLEEFKRDFVTKYLPLYKTQQYSELKEIFGNVANVEESDLNIEVKTLEVEPPTYNSEISIKNVKAIWESLKTITPAQAELEKIWVALEHTYYFDYHWQTIQQLIDRKGNNSSSIDVAITSRTIFNSGSKRSLVVNNLSLLWWIAYYFIDEENIENPYHLIEFFLGTEYRGNAVAFLSSNILSNKEIALGVLDGIKELVNNKVIVINRFAYSNSNKILNQVGGIRILDTLKRDEIKQIIVETLPFSDKVKLLGADI